MINPHRISISEATILGDGTLVLIVNVPKLIDQAEQEEEQGTDMAFTFL
jgi:chemotaxis protein histidine kinase CheA